MKITTVKQLQLLGYTGTEKDLEVFRTAVGGGDVDAKLADLAKRKQLHPDTFLVGMKDGRIGTAEEQLAKLGFDVGPKDGVLDEKLADAIAAFKKQHPELANVGRYLGTGASKAIAREAAPHRSLVFGEISQKAWAELYPKLKEQILTGKIPHSTPIAVGTYGVDSKMAADVTELKKLGANITYTPAFGLVQKHKDRAPWSGRIPSAPTGGLDGPVPAYADMKTDAERYKWGKEIGMRFRDQIAQAQKNGAEVKSWMLDEIWPSAGKAKIPEENSRAIRELMRGVLDGLRLGRDGKQMKGHVYVANLPGMTSLPQTAEMKKFWSALDAASSQILQEEYPVWSNGVKGAQANAANANAADARLAALGPDGASLAKKIVASMAPGYNPGAVHGLFKPAGTNPDGSTRWENLGLTPRQVQQYREAYMKAREAAGVVGFGEFGFVGGNEAREVIDPLVDQLVAEV